MIRRNADGSLPTIMHRDEVAEYLGLTEEAVIELRHNPDFPEHWASWRRWFYVGKEVEAWKAKQRSQLEIEDAIDANRSTITAQERERLEELLGNLLQVVRSGNFKWNNTNKRLFAQ